MTGKGRLSPIVRSGLATLTEAHSAEAAQLGDFLHRYAQATDTAQRADQAQREAVAERNRVLAEWTVQPGWNTERVAQFTGLAKTEITAAAARHGSTGRVQPPHTSRTSRASTVVTSASPPPASPRRPSEATASHQRQAATPT